MEDPQAVADAMYANDDASRSLGIVITAVDDGSATASMQVTESMCNGHDVCHGGLIFSLADSAMAFASNAANEETLAAGAAIDFVNPGRLGATLEATATRAHQRGRSSIFDVEVVDDQGVTVALFRGRTRGTGRAIIGPPNEEEAASDRRR